MSKENLLKYETLCLLFAETVRNKKSGKLYRCIVAKNLINTTNKDDGQKMIFYFDGKDFFVREYSEFIEKIPEP